MDAADLSLGRLRQVTQPSVDPFFETGEEGERLRIGEGQALGQEDAADRSSRIKPEIRVREPRPGETARASPLCRALRVDEEAEPPLLVLLRVEVHVL